jgi:hypothetical protein
LIDLNALEAQKAHDLLTDSSPGRHGAAARLGGGGAAGLAAAETTR